MIVKAEAVLRLMGGPSDFLFNRMAGPLIGEIDTVYGDLHVVGRCCVFIYPAIQVPHRISHGWINLGYSDMFQRDTTPHSILILPAHRVGVRKGALHPFDLAHFIAAGGIVEDVPGELG